MEDQKSSITTKIKKWKEQSVFLKLLTIAFIVAVLLIPQNMIMNLIEERQSLQYEAEYEVAQKWGHEQEIIGPILQIPVDVTSIIHKNETDRITEIRTEYAYFLPERLDNQVEVKNNTRKRGIYEVQLFKSKNSFSGTFSKPDFSKLAKKIDGVNWEGARIIIGIAHQNGIDNEPYINWNGTKKRMEPGTSSHLIKSGISVPVEINNKTDGYEFAFDIDIRGSKNINLIPVGKTNNFDVTSNWPHPSFLGHFVPSSHKISDSGFTASWKINDFNRSFPQQWMGQSYDPRLFKAEIALVKPVNQYSKIIRSAKYAFLVIFLTFLLYFFFEIIYKYRIHPIQYLLVGAGIVVFYLLLLSFSEHFGFNTAYFIATWSVVGLLTFYTKWVLKANSTVVWMLTLLLVIYGFLFVILQLEDHALLAGSIGVFIALTTVMYASKNIEWNNPADSQI